MSKKLTKQPKRSPKKLVADSKKPPEILELERAYGIELREQKNFDFEDEHGKLNGNSYSLNSDGKVNDLSISNARIKDLALINLFKNLESLHLVGNFIEDISSPLQINLKYLDLFGNKTKKDLSSLLRSPKLEKLGIWGRVDISNIRHLHNLRELDCSDVGIKDLDFIRELKNLKDLCIDDNKIVNIKALASLDNLEVVTITNNLVKEVPKEVAKKFDWLNRAILSEGDSINGIILNYNPLEFPPASVIELGPETVKNYYEAAEQYGHGALSEGRIIFVGDGSSGKSSIIEKILYNTFTLGRAQTNGIHIEHFHLSHPEDKRKLTFHVWDFGGQEIQHAVHKFFFTDGCLYVLVLDNRKEEDPEYWLQQIESLGGKAPVLVVFNKQDENAAETVDRKYLKEKYPNIVDFYKTSCATGVGIEELKKELNKKVIKLRTVNEQFPNNWLAIKKSIEECTSGSQHYLTYETYREICRQNHTENEAAQKLLLKYFNTIGAVTWFGDDVNLNLLHVLNPKWITQGVYKIITAKKTANLFGQIKINDFKELLQPISNEDYTYDEKHYGYILNMMKKFDLCDSPDNVHLLIPSAFGKEPKVEYKEFKGENIRTYILQFKSYMPLALIHRYTTKNLAKALDNNYWYTGIVIRDTKSKSVAMVHADKEAKRIYVRIKGESPLGLWERIRGEFADITSSYAKIPYDELVSVDGKEENHVNYDDLVSHIEAKKEIYFHPKLKKDFNVGYLMGLFEKKEETLEKVRKGAIDLRQHRSERPEKILPVVINILNNNSPTVNAQVSTQINIDIDIQVVNELGSEAKGNAVYLLEALGESNKILSDALKNIIQFASDAKAARNSGDVIEKGWGRKLKNILQTLGNAGEQFKNIQDGGEVLKSMFNKLFQLAQQFNLNDVADQIRSILPSAI